MTKVSPIKLVSFRVIELSLGRGVKETSESKGEGYFSLESYPLLNVKDNTLGRLILRSETEGPILKLKLQSDSRFKNPEGFTEESINSNETLLALINLAWPKHLEIVKYLFNKAGFEFSGVPETIEKIQMKTTQDAES